MRLTRQVFQPNRRSNQTNRRDIKVQDVAKLLQSAGLAIQALTNAAPPGTSSTEDALKAHQRAFKEASAQYFALLSSIDVRLRRQVYALEEAAIIPPESGESNTGQTTGGTNQLDISWLNSRKDSVGKDKEAELWANASKFVAQLQQEEHDPSDTAVFQSAEGDDMEVD